ncbi:hypothetical protein IMSHALPRED_004489 [Imshaugia aleurites]|uniref:Uncharacterized protein n=1 Tax=Imshaugia aleurites TaxID=172621 RepID=A0A8H3I8M5_9LECA|nr:hypothetical protein IMSHALPRED_004489 [Imshaugia aleurites]
MVRERTPARNRPKSQLGESWVVESDGDDEYTPPSKQADGMRRSQVIAESAESPRKRPSRVNARTTAEPEFIMPSIYERSVGGSWLGEEKSRAERESSEAIRKPQRSEDRGTFTSTSYLSKDGGGQEKLAKASEDVVTFITPMFKWTYDVLGGALHALKTPISYLIAGWLLVGLLVLLRNLLFSSVYSALSPVCRIPGASFFNLPMCQSPVSIQYSGEEQPPVQFDQLMTVQNKFDAVLQESAGGVSLPLDMKRGETSIRDLRQVVRFSQLHSKNELVLEFDGFIETARIASYDLQKFNSHVGRGVDNILATARWTKRVLDGIAERDGSRGAIASFFNDKLLAPFQPLKFTEDALLDQYIQHTRVVEDEINRLVTEAQALLRVLQNLEDRLDVIHGIAVRDNLHARGSKAEVLSQLWTMLGGNRSKLGKFDSQLRLLGQVNTYRQSAIAHVSGTLVRLQGMGAELEELRERVGGVELLGGKGSAPLSLHIQNIEMGVERLERGRKGAKELENEELRKSLEKGKGSERMIDG